MNLALLRGWCGRRPSPPDDVAKVKNELFIARRDYRIAVEDAENLRKHTELLERQLRAERAENTRLVEQLVNGTTPTEPPSGDAAHWKRLWEQDRRNVTAMNEELDRLKRAAP